MDAGQHLMDVGSKRLLWLQWSLQVKLTINMRCS
jgi:hypothetical protein